MVSGIVQYIGSPPFLAAESGGGKFLVQPGIGLMIWTLIAFGTTLWVLRRYVFPQIQEQLDKRQRAIEETIEIAERTRQEADQLLAEYRQRLQEARQQAEDILARARRAAERHQQEVQEAARRNGESFEETMVRADHRLLEVRVDERRDIQKRRKKKPKAS